MGEIISASKESYDIDEVSADMWKILIFFKNGTTILGELVYTSEEEATAKIKEKLLLWKGHLYVVFKASSKEFLTNTVSHMIPIPIKDK